MSQTTLQLDINGRPLSVEINRLGRQADGTALVRYGDTVVFVSACSKRDQREPKPFLPLTVDYREYTYAGGKIPGGFFKREGRPSEREILISRMIDRPIRTLFPDGYFNETQIVAYLLSADLENDSDTLAIIGASCALNFSDIPFATPLAAVRVGYIDGEFVINPTIKQTEECPLNMVVTGTEEGIVMMEAGALELDEELIVQATDTAFKAMQPIIQAQKELLARLNKPKREFTPIKPDEDKIADIKNRYRDRIIESFLAADQTTRKEKQRLLQVQITEEIPEENEDARKEIKEIFYQVQKKLAREMILKDGRRPDGRSFTDIRPITIDVGLLPRTHGSAVFTRGETQCLATVTLGTFDDTQRIDGIGEGTEKRFMLHYNFPPFSVGEVSFLRGPGRREIGHGALAEKSLLKCLPVNEEDFPYTIRVVSDVLESNGSSSMATVCGGVLALMDAGVPLAFPVAGIAMGLVHEDDRYQLLTDIAGLEDFFGDMDLKVAGSEKGITAIQMDLKVPHLPLEVFREGLKQAKVARLQVLEKMREAISTPRAEISPYAPRIINLFINPSKIGDVIGPSGKVIKNIVAETKAKIEVDDDGKITIASPNMEAVKKAEQMVRDITAEAEMGKIYTGKVVRIEDYGAFIQILPNTDGLLHVSEISHERIRNVRDVLRMGQTVRVKVVNIDDSGKVRLSKKAIESDSQAPGENQNSFDRRDSQSRDRDRNPNSYRDRRKPRR